MIVAQLPLEALAPAERPALIQLEVLNLPSEERSQAMRRLERCGYRVALSPGGEDALAVSAARLLEPHRGACLAKLADLQVPVETFCELFRTRADKGS
mmetsp:Transcript_6916/g.22944  ORF Transcript_6916/g.22944 Transcript_6916/m.22944 type:complete len:98 (+) Transcript_6916:370-663(+)